MSIRNEILKTVKYWLDMPELAEPYIKAEYNRRKPLPRGYAIKDNDAWCACMVSEALSQCDPDNPYREVSAHKLYEMLRKEFGYELSTEYIRCGDVVFFDWNNNGTMDHVGIVYGIQEDGTVVTIEGNINDRMYMRYYKDGVSVNGCKLPIYIPMVYSDEDTSAKEEKPESPEYIITEIRRLLDKLEQM